MNKSDNIRKAIKGMAGTQTATIFWAEIVKVSETDETCTIKKLSSGLEIEDVLLSINQTGMVEIPEKGSMALIGSIENNPMLLFVIKIEKTDKLKIRYKNKIVFGEGEFGGIIKIEELIKKINAIENTLNSLITACQSQTVTLAPAGAFLLAPFFASVKPIAPITQKNELENNKMIH